MSLGNSGWPGSGRLGRTAFKQFGLIPVTATTQFINAGPTKGMLNFNTGAVQTTSKITLRIVSLSVSGISVPAGTACQTFAPVDATIPASGNSITLTLGKAKIVR